MSTITATPTVLHAEHERLGAHMADFAGYLMPIRYGRIFDEHGAVRNAAGIFDLSHMGQFELHGERALAYIESLGTNMLGNMPVGRARYSILTNDDGGALDDIIVYRMADHILVVANAANTHAVQARLSASHGPDIEIRRRQDRSLIALQGPRAQVELQAFVDVELDTLKNYTCAPGKFGEDDVIIARTGYTGEDGFEIFVADDAAGRVFNALLEAGKPNGVRPAGLAARDILRLEAGMPLYGHELSETISPVQAGLGWAVRFDKGEFPGRAALQAQTAATPARIAGLRLRDRVPARPGYEVVENGEVVGEVRSATIAPSVGGASIATALIRSASAEIGHTLDIRVRGTLYKADVVELPFYRRAKTATVGSEAKS